MRPVSPATKVINKLLTSGLIAGAGAGLIAALLQLGFVQPVLLHAERYESGELTHFAAASEHEHSHDAAATVAEPAAPAEEQGHTHAPGTPEHDHGEAGHDAGGFSIDAKRDGLSILFSIGVYAGYGLLMIAALAFAESRGHRVTAREGLIWGLAGFIAVQLAPAFGLAPELPGMAAGDLGARQMWWIATVVLSAGGLWLIAFGKGWAHWAVAIAMIGAPHLIGAPQPEAFAGPTPPELAAEFGGRALGVGLMAWTLLGLFAASLWSRDRAI
jgi:cobalt transporter subunit CbtA